MDLNGRARTLCNLAAERSAALGVSVRELAGARIIDFGIEARGGLAAGQWLARICLADLARVSLRGLASADTAASVSVEVQTDHPTLACLGGQYAGWPVQAGSYFAMGSGPMRVARGREEVLEQLQLIQASPEGVVGVLETDTPPTAEVVEYVAEQCGVARSAVTLCVAPVTSLAGVVQVVARSVETALHKLHAVGMDPRQVVAGFGSAPLPPPATDMVSGIGRTNDAILYGGRVTLWVDMEPSIVEALGPRVPSGASPDHGRPFAEIFKSYGHDFYKVDPNLFSPAVVAFVNLRSGETQVFGAVECEVLRQSFGTGAMARAKESE